MLNQLLTEVKHETKCFPAKTVLLSEGSVASKLYIVRSGCIRQWHNANGKDITCQFFFEGSPVASIDSLIHATPSEYTLETVLKSEVCIIEQTEINRWLTTHNEHTEKILHFIIERMLSYSRLFLSRIKETPQERYEALVKEHPEIITQIPQHYIATYLGISPVSLSRIRGRKL